MRHKAHPFGFILAITLFGLLPIDALTAEPLLPLALLNCNLQAEKGGEYKPYTQINPFYLRFNGFGNGESLCAVLVREPANSRVIIMIFSEHDCKRWIVRNEGKGAYQGIADFSWCSDWYAVSKISVSRWISGVGPAKQALGEGIILSPGERDGFLIYWDGKNWVLSN